MSFTPSFLKSLESNKALKGTEGTEGAHDKAYLTTWGEHVLDVDMLLMAIWCCLTAQSWHVHCLLSAQTIAHNNLELFQSFSSDLHLTEAKVHLLFCKADRVRTKHPTIREEHSCSLSLWVYETTMSLFFTPLLLSQSLWSLHSTAVPPHPPLSQIHSRCSGKESFSLQTCEMLTSLLTSGFSTSLI